MSYPGIPEGADSLTAEWLHGALVAGGRTDCPPIRRMACEAIGEGVGLMAEILRCELTFAQNSRPPESVIVKLPSDNSRWWNPGERRERGGPVLPVGVRLTRRVREEYLVYFDRNATMSGAKRRGSAGMDRRPSPHRENWAAWVSPPAVRPANRKLGRRWELYQREYRYYRRMASESPIRSPALLYGAFEARTHRFVLILEDLRSMTTAGQVDGASPAQVRRAVRAAARLHGKYWDQVEPLTGSGFDETLAPQVWMGLQVSYLLSLPRALRLLSDSWSEEMKDLAEEYGLRLVDHFGQLAREPKTFVHGDYRLDNMFFGEEEDGFAVVDWQNCGVSNGLYDVAYFFAGSVSSEVRRAIERDTLREYHDTVRSLGTRDFTFARCWRLYRETLLACLILPVIAAAQLEEVPGRQLRLRDAIAQRTAAAARDLAIGALLPPLPPRLSQAGLRRVLCQVGYRAYRAFR